MTTQARPEGLSAYIAVTAAYWAFMLTDGALRMLVLLHFHTLGFSPVQLAYLFVLYEIAGMVTNLSAGWIAARFGLTATLYAGLAIQVVALLALAQHPVLDDVAHRLADLAVVVVQVQRRLTPADPPVGHHDVQDRLGLIGDQVPQADRLHHVPGARRDRWRWRGSR